MPLRARLALLCSLLAAGCGHGDQVAAPGVSTGAQTLRFGHFPNLTHVHGLVAHQLSRQGKGWFEERLGPGVKIEWLVYNAGPSAMEAMLARSLDLTYVGPNPALNAFTRSAGQEVRVIAGATLGGAALVVQPDGRIAKPEDFRGRKVATPELGNTQDVACRAWLTKNGFRITQLGGDVSVIPTANPDQLALFQSQAIDAAWTVEPWVSRLEMDAGAKVFLEDREAVTTLLVASAKLLGERRELARAVAAAHAALTEWIVANPAAAQELVRAELAAETKVAVKPDLIVRAWPRMRFAAEVPAAAIESLVGAAVETGFLPTKPDVSRMIEQP